jgi:pimeloyl-ACP methyl ester carboxylesterase
MAGVMAALAVPRARVLGWSEGADVGLCLARAYPERVERLVVWGGITVVRDEDIAVFEASRDTAAWPSKARQDMTAVYGDAYWQETYSDWCDVMQRLHARGGDAMIGPIEQVSCPTLILHGSKDAFIADIHPASLNARIPRSRLYVIESGGHAIHLSHTSEFNHVVIEFLSARRGAGPASTASRSD